MNAVSLQGFKATGGKTAHRADGIASHSKDKLFIERRDDGRYAVIRSGGVRASVVTETQAEAISRAKAMHPGGVLLVERVRNTDVGRRDKWRRA